MTGDPSNVRIREAAHTDLPRLERLGALLVKEHHDFDRRRKASSIKPMLFSRTSRGA
jgi:hypothetical protein